MCDSNTIEATALLGYSGAGIVVYIGGRYRSEEEFPVTRAQLDYWTVETEKLLDLTAAVCRERIENLKKIEHDE